MLETNCSPRSNRMRYARKLQQYISVDIYGGCGEHRCPGHLPYLKSMPCMNWLANDYKFYLAFENSNCKDYITEKLLHNGLRFDYKSKHRVTCDMHVSCYVGIQVCT